MTDYGTVRAPDFTDGLEWINTPGPLSLKAELQGKFVLLDFWTYCCINCHHVLPNLERLEQKYPDELVVVGVHSAKFTTERDAANVRHAVARHGITHPVVNDPSLTMWEQYGVRAWPTLFLIDPRGYVVGYLSGEGVFEPFDRALQKLIPQFDADGLLDRSPLTYGPERPTASPLAYPCKIAADAASERLFIADTRHHRVLVTNFDGHVLLEIGSGRAGLADGRLEDAEFRDPQGVWFDDPRNVLFIADTGNHALRRVEIYAGRVDTLSGNGAQAPPGTRHADGPGAPLNSPWDVLLHDDRLYVAMAGPHQLWAFDPETGEGGVYAGDGNEALVDAPRMEARLAQPSGLATDGRHLYFADSETSSVRRVPFGSTLEHVETLVGAGLFAFGDIDGARANARLQHPLGLAHADGIVYVADTYNHKIKRLFTETGTLVSFLGTGTPGRTDGSLMGAQFNEPGGLAVAGGRLFIADTNNHRIRVAYLDTGDVETLLVRPRPRAAAPRRMLDEQRVSPGHGRFEITLQLPEGCKPNPLHPGALTLTTESGETVVQNLTPPAPDAPQTVAYRFEPGTTRFRLEGQVYYCTEENGLCFVYPISTLASVVVAPDARGETVALPIHVRE